MTESDKSLDPFGRPIEQGGISILSDGTLNIVTP